MNKLKIAFLCIYMISLYGCASSAKYENMAYTNSIGSEYNKNIKKNIEVKKVQGGEETNPLWTSEIDNTAFKKAVELSLSSQGLLSENGRYQLKVILEKIDQPIFGLDMTVTVHVNYILIDSKDNKIIFDSVVVSPYTATFSDSMVGITRLRLANEGAGKSSIHKLLKKLSSLNIKTNEITINK